MLLPSGRVDARGYPTDGGGLGHPFRLGEVKEVAPLTRRLSGSIVVKEGQQVEAGDPLLTFIQCHPGYRRWRRARLELEQGRLELAKILGVSAGTGR